MKIRFRFNTRQTVKWGLAVLALGWLFGATWFLFINPPPTYNAYATRSGLAQCRGLPTSEARYQCTSELMLAKDRAVFNQSLIVVLPAFALMIGYLCITRFLTAHRERLRSRSAVDASRKRMAEWRRQVKERNATVPSTNGSLTPVPVHARAVSALPRRPARKQ